MYQVGVSRLSRTLKKTHETLSASTELVKARKETKSKREGDKERERYRQTNRYRRKDTDKVEMLRPL